MFLIGHYLLLHVSLCLAHSSLHQLNISFPFFKHHLHLLLYHTSYLLLNVPEPSGYTTAIIIPQIEIRIMYIVLAYNIDYCCKLQMLKIIHTLLYFPPFLSHYYYFLLFLFIFNLIEPFNLFTLFSRTLPSSVIPPFSLSVSRSRNRLEGRTERM